MANGHHEGKTGLRPGQSRNPAGIGRVGQGAAERLRGGPVGQARVTQSSKEEGERRRRLKEATSEVARSN